jgi:hypothetical protein
MLQMIKEHFRGSDKALYVSVDSPYFQAHDLLEFAAPPVSFLSGFFMPRPAPRT